MAVIHWKTAGKTLICLYFTRVCMVWQLSPWMNSNVLQGVLDAVELIHMSSRIESIDAYKFSFLPIGTLFLPPPEPSSLLILSRKPSTKYKLPDDSTYHCWAVPRPAVTGDHPSLDTHWRTEELKYPLQSIIQLYITMLSVQCPAAGAHSLHLH